MEKVRVYSSVWKFERYLYAIGDFMLPFAMSYEQIGYFIVMLALMIFLKTITGFLLINGLIHYVAVPIFVSWLLSKSENRFDGKKPYRYLERLIIYKLTEKGKYVRYKKIKAEKEFKYNDIVLRGNDN